MEKEEERKKSKSQREHMQTATRVTREAEFLYASKFLQTRSNLPIVYQTKLIWFSSLADIQLVLPKLNVMKFSLLPDGSISYDSPPPSFLP